MNKKLTIEISCNEYQEIEKLAESSNMSMDKYISKIVEEYIKLIKKERCS